MTVKILQGDCRDVLKALPDARVHCIVSSPPYYGLRSYLPDGHEDKPKELGLEQTPDAYVAQLVAVFREARRVLRDDGTLWLNLGDSYASGGNGVGSGKQLTNVGSWLPPKAAPPGYKPKDLLGIPWMVAFALRADGWYLRDAIIWHKPNPMPESVTDRCTKAYENVFLFSKRAKYFYDADAIAEPSVDSNQGRKKAALAHGTTATSERAPGPRHDDDPRHSHWYFKGPKGVGTTFKSDDPGFRNRRNVWTIATEPSGEAHFAMMPTALAELCIKAGTSEKGVCPCCGAGWVRVLHAEGNGGWTKKYQAENAERGIVKGGSSAVTSHGKRCSGADNPSVKVFLGWRPSCSCLPPDENAPIPATVLDPFAGVGTTGLVADRLGRDAVLIELSMQHAASIKRRLENDAGMFAALA